MFSKSFRKVPMECAGRIPFISKVISKQSHSKVLNVLVYFLLCSKCSGMFTKISGKSAQFPTLLLTRSQIYRQFQTCFLIQQIMLYTILWSSYQQSCRYFYNAFFYCFGYNLLSYKMKLYVNMLCSSMKLDFSSSQLFTDYLRKS